METIDNVITKRYGKTLVKFLKKIDPERKFSITIELAEAWDRLTLDDQRKLCLYLLYKRWRGELYGTPYEMVTCCHPYPTNWNGRPYINRLFKDGTKLVSAHYNGACGIYTLDEARLYEMRIVKYLN